MLHRPRHGTPAFMAPEMTSSHRRYRRGPAANCIEAHGLSQVAPAFEALPSTHDALRWFDGLASGRGAAIGL